MKTFLKENGLQLIAGFLIYLICATVFSLAYRYAINPDGVAELRLAGYLAEGHFMRSVTQSWSPLFIWLMSPLLAIGLDGLTTARITIALSGAIFLFCIWLLSRRFELSEGLRVIMLLVSALLIADFSIRNIGADLIFAAMLTFYMYLVTSPDILNNRRISFLSGAIGGVSYLAHHYAFPFFIVHYPSTLFLRNFIIRDQSRSLLKSLILGFVGFSFVCSMWIGIMSIKYGHLIITGKAGITYAAFSPKGSGGHPFFKGGLYKPRDPYAIHVFEDPSEVKVDIWSPFESKEYFLHQIRLIRMNIDYIISHFIKSSPFFTYPFVVAILSLIPVICFLASFGTTKKYLYSWTVLTFLIYSSGFILIIARSPRRFYVLMLIMIIFSFSIFEDLIKLFKERFVNKPGNVWKGKLLVLYLLLIMIPAFSLKPTIHLLKSFRNLITLEYVNPYKDIAEQIRRVNFPAPVAFIRSSQKAYTDLYLAYFLNRQFLGRPLSEDVDSITEEMANAGARSLLVFDNLDIVEALKMDDRYNHLGSIKLREDKRYWNFSNVKHDQITAWDKEVNIFILAESADSPEQRR
jgi:hypothetical protein